MVDFALTLDTWSSKLRGASKLLALCTNHGYLETDPVEDVVVIRRFGNSKAA